MKKFILIFLFTFFNIYSQNESDLFKLSIPEYVLKNSETEIAAVCQFKNGDYDKVEILLNTQNQISVNEVFLNSKNNSVKLNYLKIDDPLYDGNTYSIILDKSEFKISEQIIQLLFKVSVGNLEESILNYSVFYLKNEQVINEINSSEKFDERSQIITTYEPNKLVAGQALKINKQNVFEIKIEENNLENLAVEFWSEINDCQEFLEIKTKYDQKLSFAKNKFKVLEIDTEEDVEVSKTSILSNGSWNHFLIHFDSYENQIGIYVNGELNYYCKHNFYGDIKFIFGSENDALILDELFIWKLNDDPELISENSRFRSKILQNSKLISRMSFEKNLEFDKNELIISEAPVISRAPELNIEGYSNFYSLFWQSVDDKNVKEFILEKSTDGKVFNEIYSIEKFTEDTEDYTFTDIKDPADKIVFYRIKQINNDDSFIYSAQLKIGQKKRKNFVLKPNYPNPFNPKTKITVELLEETDIIVTVYNIVGIKVEKLYKGSLPKGEHNFDFDGSELTSGIYLLEIKTPVSTEVMKMILAK